MSIKLFPSIWGRKSLKPEDFQAGVDFKTLEDILVRRKLCEDRNIIARIFTFYQEKDAEQSEPEQTTNLTSSSSRENIYIVNPEARLKTEAVPTIIKIFSKETTLEKLEVQFRLWDADLDGYLTSQDVIHLLGTAQLAKKIKKALIMALKEEEGRIDVKQFLSFIGDDYADIEFDLSLIPSEKIDLLDSFDIQVMEGQKAAVIAEVRKMINAKKSREKLFTATDKRGKTLLHLAVEWKSEELIDLLLTCPVKPIEIINLKDGSAAGSKTALACAARAGDERIFMKLFNYGADVDQTCFDYVCREFCSKNCERIIEALLERGKDKININSTVNGETPLCKAAQNKKENIVEGLNGSKIMTELLLKHGADPNIPSKHGDTPLHIALYGSRDLAVQLLITHGADLNAKGKEGLNPVELAEKYQLTMKNYVQRAKEISEMLKNVKFHPDEPYKTILSLFLLDSKGKQNFLEMTREGFMAMGIRNPQNLDTLVKVQEEEKHKKVMLITAVEYRPQIMEGIDKIPQKILSLEDLYFKMPTTYNPSTNPIVINEEMENLLKVRVTTWHMRRGKKKHNPNCLFTAVAKQLFDKSVGGKVRASEVRKDAVDWLKRHPMTNLEHYYSYRTPRSGSDRSLTESVGRNSPNKSLADFDNDQFKRYIDRMNKETEYGDFWMLIAISEFYTAKICIITSLEGERHIALITPKERQNTRTLMLAAHLHALYFDPLQERDRDVDSTSDWLIDASDLDVGSEIIGRGAQGIVLKGKYRSNPVAVKQMNLATGNSGAVSESLRTRIEQELSIMRRIKHRNVVLFMGACLAPDRILIVTEFMEKGNLHEFLLKRSARSRLEDRNALLRYNIAKHIASAMVFIHESNYVHCDLTSKNVLLDEDYVAKVSDFGLARLAANSQFLLGGDRCWAAPEILRKETKEGFLPSVDVFSYGIILWQLFSLSVPWEGFRDYTDYVKAVRDDKYRPPIPQECNARWAGLINSCWDEDAKKRPDFKQILGMLKQFKNEFKPSLPRKYYDSVHENFKRDLSPFPNTNDELFPNDDSSSAFPTNVAPPIDTPHYTE